MRSGRRAGYTLIELAITLTIAGVMAAWSVLHLGTSLGHARVNRAASLLATDLQYAQLLAARQREPVVVIANSSLRNYIIRDQASATIYRTRFVGQDTEYLLDSLGASPATVEIRPNGLAGQTTVFELGLKGYRREVHLSRAGQVRIVNVP